ncbi:uncharacterized protein SETTUDRAFT_172788 [Exserohilum turcica Et28A]|uniref:Uncharacterized protein n=1 Tax=Exserohilum turcicum (strain 28A) TaxID=671987 RepID=R0IH97_EXST2|nr:uncharacterized protein SETTUDRAFT_172788 [Exserohilum turcica Et28A]EOA84356.1 hypothetical protein SETTUDRAFT_172788 [Exserohilum turcica Et28A]
MKEHAANGLFSNGKELHRVYLGLPFIDGPLSWSVSFWDPVLHQSEPVLLLSTTLSASLQSLGVFTMVESLRKGKRNVMLRWSPVNVFAWQYIGAAIFIPLYFMVELESHYFPDKASDPEVPPLHAKALLPASIVTIIHLYRMVYFPPQGTTTAQHQAWIAVWQLAPLWCYCVLTAISTYLSPKDETAPSHERDADLRWIKATYAVFGLFSGVMHVSAMYQLCTSQDPSASLAEAFMPRLSSLWQPDTASSVFIAESTFFLQWDYIVIVVAGGIYVAEILGNVYGLNYGFFGGVVLTLAACVASHFLSLGLVWAVVLFLREDSLRARFRASIKSEGSGKK